MSLLSIYLRAARAQLRLRGIRGTWVETAHGRIHCYRSQGRSDGPRIVILHGLGSNATTYAPLLGRLKAEASVLLAPDLPGHGFSDRPAGGLEPSQLQQTVNDVLCTICDEPFVLMGTSLGGGLAFRFALAHPERVSKLILCSPAGAPLPDEAAHQLFSRFEMNTVADGIDYVRTIFHRPPWYTPILGREVFKLLGSPMVQRLVAEASPDDFLSVHEAEQLLVPTLLIWGQSERLLPQESLRWYRAHLPPTTQFAEPQGYGHCPHLEQASDLVRRIMEFSNA